MLYTTIVRSRVDMIDMEAVEFSGVGELASFICRCSSGPKSHGAGHVTLYPLLSSGSLLG